MCLKKKNQYSLVINRNSYSFIFINKNKKNHNKFSNTLIINYLLNALVLGFLLYIYTRKVYQWEKNYKLNKKNNTKKKKN